MRTGIGSRLGSVRLLIPLRDPSWNCSEQHNRESSKWADDVKNRSFVSISRDHFPPPPLSMQETLEIGVATISVPATHEIEASQDFSNGNQPAYETKSDRRHARGEEGGFMICE
jgi:hypothetical protein